VNVTGLRGLDLLPASLDLFEIQDQLVSVAGGQVESDASTEILEAAVRPILEDCDYVVMDCPANLGVITLDGLRIADGYIVPTGADVLSAYAIRMIVKHVHHFSGTIGREIAPLGVLVTRCRPPTRLTQVSVKSLREDSTIPRILNTVIPKGRRISRRSAHSARSTAREKGNPLRTTNL
jgi:chromosome partitioning protein